MFAVRNVHFLLNELQKYILLSPLSKQIPKFLLKCHLTQTVKSAGVKMGVGGVFPEQFSDMSLNV